MNEQVSMNWYTTAFASHCLKKHFRKNGFRIVKENPLATENSMMLFTKLLSKERVEIKATVSETGVAEPCPEEENSKGFMDFLHYIIDAALSPMNNFGSDEERGLCLPGTSEYRKIAEKLDKYFTSNNLSVKIYLVNEDGTVTSV